MRMVDLMPGWAVVGNDGRRVATVRDVGQHYVLVTRGRPASDLYIPASAIANVKDEVVHLNVASSDVGAMGWHEPPRTEDAPVASPESELHRHV
jgi:hypothetical protein